MQRGYIAGVIRIPGLRDHTRGHGFNLRFWQGAPGRASESMF